VQPDRLQRIFFERYEPDDFRKLLPYLPEVEAGSGGWGESCCTNTCSIALDGSRRKAPRGVCNQRHGIDESLISELLKVGVDFMGFSLPGPPQTHNAMVNSDLKDLQNILTLQEMKARQNLVNPRLHIVYLLLKENIREVPALSD
jgi:hypothetical protein